MGIGARRYLVGPRLLAVTLLTPCLVVVSNLAAMSGAALVCKAQFRLSYLGFWQTVMDALVFRDIVAGTVKSVIFGMLVGLIACYKGLAVRGGAAGVGDATTSSVVTAITTVIGFDTLFNVVQTTLFQ